STCRKPSGPPRTPPSAPPFPLRSVQSLPRAPRSSRRRSPKSHLHPHASASADDTAGSARTCAWLPIFRQFAQFPADSPSGSPPPSSTPPPQHEQTHEPSPTAGFPVSPKHPPSGGYPRRRNVTACSFHQHPDPISLRILRAIRIHHHERIRACERRHISRT